MIEKVICLTWLSNGQIITSRFVANIFEPILSQKALKTSRLIHEMGKIMVTKIAFIPLTISTW